MTTDTNDGYSSNLVNTEAKLALAIRDYIQARTNEGPLDDMADECLGAMNETLQTSYGVKIEENQ